MKKLLSILILVMMCSAKMLGAPGDVPFDSISAENPYKFRAKQLILPCTMIGVGVWGSYTGWFGNINTKIRDELQKNIEGRMSFDNYVQYAPMLSIYVFDICGVKGRHNPVEQTVLLGTSYLVMGALVNSFKYTLKRPRPDETSRNSFPSGHTATAFMGAELLRREYWDKNPWIGIAGYGVAIGTGLMRMYNNRHWLSDVIAGAGIGILSVEAAYWLYPVITKALMPKLYEKNIYIGPSRHGVTLSMTL